MDMNEEVQRWYLTLAETSNKTFLPLYWDEHRYLVLKGGGGSGKSVFAARKIIERAEAEVHRFLVCRKVANTIRESCWRNILNQLAQFYPGTYKANLSNMTITLGNGSTILFAGLDDVEKLKSIVDIDGIWIEEASELLQSDFNQLDIRMRGESPYYQQIIFSFNPISVTHWLKERFFNRHDDRCRTHESTYKDNRFLPDEDKKTLEAFKETDRYYYEVYCLGLWGTTGQTVFDGEAVTNRLLENIQPIATGHMEYVDDGLSLKEIRFQADRPDPFAAALEKKSVLGAYRKTSPISVYKMPEEGVPYVIGADTAGDGSDRFVAQVLDNRTGEQVCVLRQQFDEDLFAKQVFALGMWYNEALLAIETNWSTYPVLTLERLGYPNQYVRETIDNYTHKTKKAFGFDTNSKTRPVIISELVKAVREDITIVNHDETLKEMLTFIRNENFRPEAEEGAHDDCVMSLAIAHYIRPKQDYTVAVKEPERPWTEDMLDDYENASPREKAYLRSIWGVPKR